MIASSESLDVTLLVFTIFNPLLPELNAPCDVQETRILMITAYESHYMGITYA